MLPSPLLLKPYIQRNGVLAAVLPGGYHCYFDKQFPYPEVGVETPMMICTNTRVVQADPPSTDLVIRSLIIRPVSQDDVMVHHSGFIMEMGSAEITADVKHIYGDLNPRIDWLTPGRTNVRVAYLNGTNEVVARPGYAWVNKNDVAAGMRRITGVPSLGELDPRIVERLVVKTREG